MLAFAGEVVFGDDSPVKLLRAFYQQCFKGVAQIAFVIEVEFAEFF
jgi:hypothetical protein